MIHLTNEPRPAAHGGWTMGLYGGTTGELLQVFDPQVPYLVIEGHSPTSGVWVDMPVSLLPDEPAVQRRVRNLRYDVLLRTHEALALGDDVIDRAYDGSILMWQSTRVPTDTFRLLDVDDAQWLRVMQETQITTILERPHLDEVALVRFVDESRMQGALDRLGLSTTS